MYKTVRHNAKAQIEIKKSIFISNVKYVDEEEDALSFIESIKEEYRDASHNVYAYIVLSQSEIQRFSDDGEPAGTAGIPILEILKRESLKNISVVVTRYFGGTLLGAGGLIRAYTRSASMALSKAEIVVKERCARIRIAMDYGSAGKIKYILKSPGYIILNESYTENVSLEIHVKTEYMQKLQSIINDISSSKSSFDVLGYEYVVFTEK